MSFAYFSFLGGWVFCRWLQEVMGVSKWNFFLWEYEIYQLYHGEVVVVECKYYNILSCNTPCSVQHVLH
jgi:hypothetical protein